MLVSRVVKGLGTSLLVPDLWQSEAVRHLQAGKDVIVNAPTGAGKTFIFELLFEMGFKHQAVFTVPTRALANDKLYEWRRRGWNVGIATGDVSEKTDAPVVVATLETQKGRLLRGEGPGLLVIDEYQMLADPKRGMNYELAIALAPVGTQLLMLSGSVGNPERIVNWLNSIGRDAVLVSHRERPVPLEEIQLEALPDRVSAGVRGLWPRMIARALDYGLGPILVFAPQRKDAEAMAMKISGALPEKDWLELTPEQRALAGDPLAKLLRNRIAFHHSGLNYLQRAGLIEPLAKKGHLRVIVATTGLAAGINFSMKSVLVTEREYRHGGMASLVRPDELLQMFGRAGRRGLDEKGYVLVAPGKPRLSEGRPLSIKRSGQMDWPAFLRRMHEARREGMSPVQAAEELAHRLFTDHPVKLGLRDLRPRSKNAAAPAEPVFREPPRKIKQMFNSGGTWERLKPPVKVQLGDCLLFREGKWTRALSEPATLESVTVGNLCRLPNGAERTYGRQVAVAMLPQKEHHRRVALTKWLHRGLREYFQKHHPDRPAPRRLWDLDAVEHELLPLLPRLTSGGRPQELFEHNNLINVRLDYSEATIHARIDSHGRSLINPPIREVEPEETPSFAELIGDEKVSARRSPAEIWQQLGLIDDFKRPTRRGVVFSFFNHGEGLAIAAALEDRRYPLEELIFDLANLRAGHRFEEFEDSSARLGNVCRITYRGLSLPGYLEAGIPPGYGNGAAEVLAEVRAFSGAENKFVSETLRHGDIERAALEWRSLLNHVACAPDLAWDRWRDFQAIARIYVETHFAISRAAELPELTPSQRERYLTVGV